jgi:hypothetical protein
VIPDADALATAGSAVWVVEGDGWREVGGKNEWEEVYEGDGSNVEGFDRLKNDDELDGVWIMVSSVEQNKKHRKWTSGMRVDWGSAYTAIVGVEWSRMKQQHIAAEWWSRLEKMEKNGAAEWEAKVKRWRGGEVERKWRGGEVERWRGGEVERWRGGEEVGGRGEVEWWRGGEVERWRGEEVERWRGGERWRGTNANFLTYS